MCFVPRGLWETRLHHGDYPKIHVQQLDLVKIVSDRHEESLREDDVQPRDNAFYEGSARRNLNSPKDIHRLEKDVSDEERAFQDAPVWAKLMHRERD